MNTTKCSISLQFYRVYIFLFLFIPYVSVAVRHCWKTNKCKECHERPVHKGLCTCSDERQGTLNCTCPAGVWFQPGSNKGVVAEVCNKRGERKYYCHIIKSKILPTTKQKLQTSGFSAGSENYDSLINACNT